MTPDQEILEQLKLINKKLGPNVWRNFLSGLSYSVGNFVGTMLLFAVLFFIASKINWVQIFTNSFNSFASQINWQKIIPAPKIQIETPSLFK